MWCTKRCQRNNSGRILVITGLFLFSFQCLSDLNLGSEFSRFAWLPFMLKIILLYFKEHCRTSVFPLSGTLKFFFKKMLKHFYQEEKKNGLLLLGLLGKSSNYGSRTEERNKRKSSLCRCLVYLQLITMILNTNSWFLQTKFKVWALFRELQMLLTHSRLLGQILRSR